MKCSNCGSENSSDCQHCSQCGAKLAAVMQSVGEGPTAGRPAQDIARSVVFSGWKDPIGDELTVLETQGYLREGVCVGSERFRLVRQLGLGGMGVVWLAEDLQLSASNQTVQVALKFLAPHIHNNARALKMMRNEFLRCCRLRHHNIIDLYNWHGDEAQLPFISMEYVEGLTLNELRQQQPGKVLSWSQLRPFVEQACAALDYAHNVEGVVHRDLKPGNIMVDGKGTVRLADFGLAWPAATNPADSSSSFAQGGTLAFMSPQQFYGCQPTVADDVYSLGATLYCLLTSTPPFYEGDIGAQLVGAAPQSIPERLAKLGLRNPVPSKLLTIIGNCLEKTPLNRPSALEILKKLPPAFDVPAANQLANAAPTFHAEEPSASSSSGSWLALLLVLLTGAAGWIGFQHHSPQHPVPVTKPSASTNTNGVPVEKKQEIRPLPTKTWTR